MPAGLPVTASGREHPWGHPRRRGSRLAAEAVSEFGIMEPVMHADELDRCTHLRAFVITLTSRGERTGWEGERFEMQI